MNEILETYTMTPEEEIKWLRQCVRKLQEENQKLKKQLEYLRSGEYLNQLKFERNLLEDIVATAKVSKEDKEFIDMTHRNTELLEETQAFKQTINELSNKISKLVEEKVLLRIQISSREKVANDLQQRINKAIHRIQLLQMDNEVTVRDLGLIVRDLKGDPND